MSEMPADDPVFLEVIRGLELPAEDPAVELSQAYIALDGLAHQKATVVGTTHDPFEAIELEMPGQRGYGLRRVRFWRHWHDWIQIESRDNWGMYSLQGIFSPDLTDDQIKRMTEATLVLREAVEVLETDFAWAKIISR